MYQCYYNMRYPHMLVCSDLLTIKYIFKILVLQNAIHHILYIIIIMQFYKKSMTSCIQNKNVIQHSDEIIIIVFVLDGLLWHSCIVEAGYWHLNCYFSYAWSCPYFTPYNYKLCTFIYDNMICLRLLPKWDTHVVVHRLF